MTRATFDDFSVYEGSIVVEFDVSGSEADIDQVIDEIYSLVSLGLDITFNNVTVTTQDSLIVNGDEYADEDDDDDEDEDDSLPLWAIVLIALAAATLLIALLAFLIYKVWSKKRIDHQLKLLEEKKSLKRRDRNQRHKNVTVNEMDDQTDNFYNVKGGNGGYSSSHASLDSRTADDALIIPTAAPNATTYSQPPPQSDNFDFINVRPLSSYNPPGRLPALGANKPKTPDSIVSASGLQVDHGIFAPGTPDFGRRLDLA